MRYAKSLLYGGMLVDAEKADYQDYARLLLRCPFCGSPVFLVKGKHRNEHQRTAPKSKQLIAVKSSEVKPAFSHFPGIASENCEIKSSGISQSYIKRSFNVGRNQRLKFFQNRFGEIVSAGCENIVDEKSFDYCMKRANPELDAYSSKYLFEIKNTLMRDFKHIFRHQSHICKQYAEEVIDEIRQHPTEIVIAETQEELEEASNFLSRLELDLHYQIIVEAIEYLSTKSAEPLLDRMFAFGFYSWRNSFVHKISEREFLKIFALGNYRKISELDEMYRSMVTQLVYGAVCVLCGTQWADAIRDLSGHQKF